MRNRSTPTSRTTGALSAAAVLCTLGAGIPLRGQPKTVEGQAFIDEVVERVESQVFTPDVVEDEPKVEDLLENPAFTGQPVEGQGLTDGPLEGQGMTEGLTESLDMVGSWVENTDETLLGNAKVDGQGKPNGYKLPWVPRRRSGVFVGKDATDAIIPGALSRVRLKALGLRSGPRSYVGSHRWPPEPGTPNPVDRKRFDNAVVQLCPHWLPKILPRELAAASLDAASAMQVDPFLLVALAYQQSRCDTAPKDSWGVGVTRINVGMHRKHVHQNGYYRYRRPTTGGGFAPAQLPMRRFRFGRERILRFAPNLYFAAAFLHVFEQQCPHIDRPFRSVAHRHPVSHIIWGDQVRSALPEDLVLTARRRLLTYYHPPRQGRRAVYRHVVFSSPLDGAPRIVVGLMGDPRESGKRRHAGIDFLSVYGEPVRAMAPGVVSFSGVDSRKRGFVALSPEESKRANRERLGPRGLFVQVDHGGEVSTLYVHLAESQVTTGQHVERGDILGYVGRTGIHSSDAHLHLGLFDQGVPIDPLPHLQPLALTADGIPTVDMTRLQNALSNAQGGS